MLCTLNAGAFDIAPRMTYRTNEVEFTSASDITIVDGAYTIDDLSITDGQDPAEPKLCRQDFFSVRW